MTLIYMITMTMMLMMSAEYAGLAIDIRRQKLYYTDDTGGKVGELSTDGTGHRVLIHDVNYKPWAAVLDNDNR